MFYHLCTQLQVSSSAIKYWSSLMRVLHTLWYAFSLAYLALTAAFLCVNQCSLKMYKNCLHSQYWKKCHTHKLYFVILNNVPSKKKKKKKKKWFLQCFQSVMKFPFRFLMTILSTFFQILPLANVFFCDIKIQFATF